MMLVFPRSFSIADAYELYSLLPSVQFHLEVRGWTQSLLPFSELLPFPVLHHALQLRLPSRQRASVDAAELG